MLRIGYVRLRDASADEDRAALTDAGCQVIRTEERGRGSLALSSILQFIGAGDQLVVVRLNHLATTGTGLLQTLNRLEARGASLLVLHPHLSSQGLTGVALRAAIEAVADLEPLAVDRRRRSTTPANEIYALQQAGVGPVEIARRLGVSRMTVWRKLKSVEAAAGA